LVLNNSFLHLVVSQLFFFICFHLRGLLSNLSGGEQVGCN
jgi:hypothetical protein